MMRERKTARDCQPFFAEVPSLDGRSNKDVEYSGTAELRAVLFIGGMGPLDVS